MTLKLWGGESDSGCCSVSDVEDARRVAAQLDIPHYVFNFSDDFDANVVAPYAEAYEDGRTPNPCVECNRTMKFGRALDRARQLGFDAVATGHHARVVRTARGFAIARGADPAKDQSYVLYMLGQEQLRQTMLPVGELTKAEVRARAAELGLRTAAKAESMDVCFITKGGRESFLGARIERRPGAIVDAAGTELAHHDGIDAFTIGQRRGLAVAAGERRYVTDIAPGTGTVTIGTRDDLLRDRVSLDDVTWASGRSPNGPVLAQWRAHGDAGAGIRRRQRRALRHAAAPRCARSGRRAVRRRRRARRRHRCALSSSTRGSPRRGDICAPRMRHPCASGAPRSVGATRRLQTRKADGGSVHVWSGRAVGATRRLQTRSHGPGPSYGWRARRRAAARRRTSARRVGATSTTSVSTSAPPVRPARRANVKGARRVMVTLLECVPRRRSRACSNAGSGVVAAKESTCSRRMSAGSTRMRGSTITTPAGTSTSQRRDSPCSARAKNAGDRKPHDEGDDPEQHVPRSREQRPGRDPDCDERDRDRHQREELRDGDAQREPVLVAVGQRVGGRNRERGREHQDGGEQR